MAGMHAQCQRRSIIRSQTTERAEDEHFAAGDGLGVPPHANVLREPEKVPAGRVAEEFFGQRQLAFWAWCFGADLKGFLRSLKERRSDHARNPYLVARASGR